MRPWIKHWRDWAMVNLFSSLRRSGPQPQALHYSFEKAGLTLDDQPIPWNAEVVVVEALWRLDASTPRRKADFTLKLPGQDPIPADTIRHQSGDDRSRLTFRLKPPVFTQTAEVHWRGQRRGQITLPILSQDEFLQNLRLLVPTLFVRLGEQHVACQTFVGAQCQGLMASAVLTSAHSLVPLLDLGVQIELRSERTGAVHSVPAKLTSSQLTNRQALLAVTPRRFPRRTGAWIATWLIGDRPLATQRICAISQRAFQRSLRISDTRFVVQTPKGEVKLSRQVPPLHEVGRVGPCFLVTSTEPGMAALATLQVQVQFSDGAAPASLQEQSILITDGPTMVAPGTLDTQDLAGVSAFELTQKKSSLGLLPLSPVPTANFTSEGGFKPTPDFTWSLAADEELNDRLNRLLDGRDGK
ncbi:MAG: hypothetical protein AB7K24_16065 [Gemmataceae bacterium]